MPPCRPELGQAWVRRKCSDSNSPTKWAGEEMSSLWRFLFGRSVFIVISVTSWPENAIGRKNRFSYWIAQPLTKQYKEPVLLTITSTAPPATDLGHLLRKHPGRRLAGLPSRAAGDCGQVLEADCGLDALSLGDQLGGQQRARSTDARLAITAAGRCSLRYSSTKRTTSHAFSKLDPRRSALQVPSRRAWKT